MTKNCAKCNQTKEYSKFYNETKNKTSGCSSYCKECVKLHARENKEEWNERRRVDYHKPENRTKRILAQKQKLENNPEYALLKWAKARSSINGCAFNLTIEDIIIPKYCPLLKKELLKYTDYAPSLDKIIPHLGYVKGNIVVISKKANMMKSHASLEELLEFCSNASVFYNKLTQK